jgi:phosphoglycolate phosphatase-like HAD superfamily hydrolase
MQGRQAFFERALATAACAAITAQASAQTDPLPSWNAGPARQAIQEFVADVTRPGAPGSVPPAERIAVFDNDGTLWSERPLYFQLAFALQRVKELAPQHPEWKDQEPFKTLLSGDVEGALGQGEKAILEIVAATHAGMTTDEFARTVGAWAKTAKHPRFGRLYTEMVYQPMLELLGYLRASGFKTFIVSGGGVEFMRAWAETVYAIPPEQVVGSSGVTRFEMRPTGPVLLKEAKLEFVDDGPGKPAGINRFIGRRPVLAFGNSDGDHQMLQWTAAGAGRRLMGLVHHTDADREWAYDRQSHIGKLDKALDEALARGWTVVDMKQDWKRIYPFDK